MRSLVPPGFFYLLSILVLRCDGYQLNAINNELRANFPPVGLGNEGLSRRFWHNSVHPSFRLSSKIEHDDSPCSQVTFETREVNLSNGINAQVISSYPTSMKKPSLPFIVFVHGSFHAAWCWKEHYMGYFSSMGYQTFALSLRGTGGTFAGDGKRKVKIMEHVEDLDLYLKYLQGNNGDERKIILISHSFGGLVVMKYLEKICGAVSHLSGLVFLCSVPPSGNGKMTMRFMKESLRKSWKITAGFAMKKCIVDAELCRDLFFATNEDPSGGLTDQDIQRYQSCFKRDTVATIDLIDLSNKLPSQNADSSGKYKFVHVLPPTLVIGAEYDYIVDKEGVYETSIFFNVVPSFVKSPHDIMLGRKWREGAGAIMKWLQS